MNPHIQLVSKEQTWDLRSRVLRPGMPLEKSQFGGDLSPQSFHVAAVDDDGKVLACGTFHEEIFPDFPEKKAYRLRGMATDPDYRGLGFGKRIMLFAERELHKRQCEVLWFNARESAFTFYAQFGFVFTGEMFDLPGIGPHKVMYKTLL
jgi:predicted GNAT family N-acyltransferase